MQFAAGIRFATATAHRVRRGQLDRGPRASHELADPRILAQRAGLSGQRRHAPEDHSTALASPASVSAGSTPLLRSASDTASVCASSASVEAGVTAERASVARHPQHEQMQVDAAIMARRGSSTASWVSRQLLPTLIHASLSFMITSISSQ